MSPAQERDLKGEAHFARRAEPGELQRAIESWKAALALQPDAAELRLKLARAEYLLGRAIAGREGGRDAAAAHFDEGMRQAESLLGDTAQTLDGTRDLEQLGGAIEPALVPAIYWRALNQQAKADLAGIGGTAAFADQTAATLALCGSVRPDYDQAGAFRVLGAYYADPPSTARRDLSRARQHFEQALAVAPNYLPNRVQYARTYAVAAQDRELFRHQLQHVVDANDLGPAEVAADNQLAQRIARSLLERQAELFE